MNLGTYHNIFYSSQGLNSPATEHDCFWKIYFVKLDCEHLCIQYIKHFLILIPISTQSALN